MLTIVFSLSNELILLNYHLTAYGLISFFEHYTIHSLLAEALFPDIWQVSL